MFRPRRLSVLLGSVRSRDASAREAECHLLEEIKNQGGEAAFHKFYFNTKEKIVQALSSSEAFAKFAQDDSFLAPAEQEEIACVDLRAG